MLKASTDPCPLDPPDRASERRMGKWRKLYFALAVLSALFLLESFSPFF
jgi:hypothetical protein